MCVCVCLCECRDQLSLSVLSYAAKPSEDCEDPEDVRAIRLATENMGDFKLKTAKDFTVPEHLRMNVEKKKAQLLILEEQVRMTHHRVDTVQWSTDLLKTPDSCEICVSSLMPVCYRSIRGRAR